VHERRAKETRENSVGKHECHRIKSCSFPWYDQGSKNILDLVLSSKTPPGVKKRITWHDVLVGTTGGGAVVQVQLRTLEESRGDAISLLSEKEKKKVLKQYEEKKHGHRLVSEAGGP